MKKPDLEQGGRAADVEMGCLYRSMLCVACHPCHYTCRAVGVAQIPTGGKSHRSLKYLEPRLLLSGSRLPYRRLVLGMASFWFG